MRSRFAATTAATLLTAMACGDAPTSTALLRATSAAVHSAAEAPGVPRAQSTVQWNKKVVALFRARAGDVARATTYMSIAQYRAARAADDDRHGKTRPSIAGAVAGASVVVLKQFYPLDAAAMEAELDAQRAAPPVADERNKDFAAGEAIGRQIGAAVLAWAATDNAWTDVARHAADRTGILDRAAAPRRFAEALARDRSFSLREVSCVFRFQRRRRSARRPFSTGWPKCARIALTRTPEQTAITLKWVPFSGPLFNAIATDLIEKYHRSELEASRILAYANAAAIDAIIACFDVKFTYWFIRPTQADPTITLATPLPNHPSYPSAHSCQTGALETVLEDAFPSERAMLDATAQEASISRVYGGLHYRFDGVAGLALGRLAGRLALSRGGLE
jgi:hypothetical protein